MKRTQAKRYTDLKSWRDDQELSQVEAAKILGISQIAYSRFERRAQFAKGKLARRLIEKTGVPLEVIAGVA